MPCARHALRGRFEQGLDWFGRKLDYNSRAKAIGSAIAANRSAMCFDDLPTEIEPDPRSARCSQALRPLVLHAEELVEDSLAEFWRNSAARVRHGKTHDG